MEPNRYEHPGLYLYFKNGERLEAIKKDYDMVKKKNRDTDVFMRHMMASALCGDIDATSSYNRMRAMILGDFNERTIPQITKVIFNDPATIVFWGDGTKTVVKAQNESFDKEKGLAMAIAKKAMSNRGNYFNEIKKWTEE